MLKVYRLTRNVNAEHLQEIFGEYGEISAIDLPIDQSKNHRGFATIEYIALLGSSRSLPRSWPRNTWTAAK